MFAAWIVAALFFVGPRSAQSANSAWQVDLTFLTNALMQYHANAFHTISRSSFLQRVQEIRRRLPYMGNAETIVAIKQLVALIGDAHTGFGFSSRPINFYIFPIKVYRYSDGIYIQAAAPKYRDVVGARIASIGNVSAAEAERRLDTVADASNSWTKRWWLPFTIRGEVFKALGLSTSADSAVFGVERAGKIRAINIPVLRKPFTVDYNLGAPPGSDWVDARGSVVPLYLQQVERPLWFARAGTDTLYIRCSVVGDSAEVTFDEFFARAFAYADRNGIDRIILDLRMNGGGNNELTPSVVQRIVARPRVNQRGHLFVVIGRSTQSAAENLVDRLQRDTEAVFVGEPTGERPNMYGDPQPFVLPRSRITVNIASLYWQDMGPSDDRDTTGPEIAAELTEADFENGKDPALEAIARPIPPAFPAVIRKVAADGPTSIRSAYYAYVTDPVHRFAQVEAATEDLIEDFIDEKRYEAAMALCDLNLQRYKTAPAYDTLGDLQEALKNVDAAKAAYHSALRVDPRDALAASRLSVLS
jgi:Peptidase family S41